MLRFYKNHGNATYSLRGDARPKCLLFGEGDAEALFLEKWLTEIGRDPNDIAVICFKGPNLSVIFRSLYEAENFSGVQGFGFFLDAEGGNASNRAASIENLLKKFSLVDPGDKLTAGKLLTARGKRIALFVSPNNDEVGFIEHIVMKEISTTDLDNVIREFEQGIEGVLGMKPNPKVLVQAYLGARKPGLCGTGRGFTSGILDVMHPTYDHIRNTLDKIL